MYVASCWRSIAILDNGRSPSKLISPHHLPAAALASTSAFINHPRCQLLGLECARGLKLIFREDALQRGISFGREGTHAASFSSRYLTNSSHPGVWSKKGGTAVPDRITETGFQEAPLTQYNGRWVFLNLNEHDFQDIHETRSVPRTCPSLHPHQRIIYPFTSLSIPTSIYHPLHSFPDTESYLLDYFIRDISPHCSLSELNNPYTSFVVPLGFVSVTLRHALLAVAANRLYLLGKDEYAEQVCYYKHMALRGLQQELSAGVHDDGTVASILMLCFQDVSLSLPTPEESMPV
ncbi:hypothetical protein N7456_010053 [Penicillium angulare]|uniref:Uncharacterized protein n=1 Tax=Penicillium angulare TaxID=116970 RepID=A0A9W9F634_9EURO|nr:hypothetical protein N7456_010053 [Penicillium angulare]